MSQPHVVVVGAGVIGLSCALQLQGTGCLVTIVARDFPGPFETMDPADKINYASPWAGAHNRWVPFHPSRPAHLRRDHFLAVRTWKRMAELYASHPHAAGITFLKGIEYFEKPGPEYLAIKARSEARDRGGGGGGGGTDEEARQADEFLDSLPAPIRTHDGRPPLASAFEVLAAPGDPPAGADPNVAFGFAYPTWCVHPTVYLCFLLRRFVLAGGRLVRRALADLEEAFALPLPGGRWPAAPRAVVVDASGAGLVRDPAVTVARGQTVLVAEDVARVRSPASAVAPGGSAREPATVTRHVGGDSRLFVIPRGFDGGTVVGGTFGVRDWDPEPCRWTREQLLGNVHKLHLDADRGAAEHEGLTVLRDIVGRRPLRLEGPRIEREGILGLGFVVHAYGMGGRGYELSWGVAEKVAEEVRDQITRTRYEEEALGSYGI
ncbi:hypothetical protein VTJ83DRAFT_2212 [Remersonia thermophila]|uniref:FAD dependent oxidoreductase domain-containing protein n=1 Tax=Remersonia thermophila TaxID=72144 RepID=A0ABR4DI29_9PEZI